MATSVAELIQKSEKTAFSFEVLPPLRGKTIDSVFRTIDILMPFQPLFVEVTTHRSDYVYRDKGNGTYERVEQRLRPGTVAIASAIKQRYHVPVVPHIICSGYNRQDTENELIDYSFLDIKDLLVLRGDKAKQDARFVPKAGGLSHATELIEQVEQFNKGLLEYGDRHEFCVNRPFTYGVAAYPEKHEEAMNLQQDIERLKEKQDLGAGYAVTQLFFDTDAYLRFVDKCRASGITMPIVPGLKPLGTLNHCTMLPRVFHVDFPVELSEKLSGLKSDDDVKKVGIEWCIAQCERLKKEGVQCIHFYTMNAAGSIEQIAREVWK